MKPARGAKRGTLRALRPILSLRAAFLCRRGICTPGSFSGKRGGPKGRKGYVPPSLCSCTKRRWYPPEKNASPLPFAPANAPPEGEKLLPKEGIFLISTAVVQADSRFQYAKAARPFALYIKFPPCQQCASTTESRRVSVRIWGSSCTQIPHCGLY